METKAHHALVGLFTVLLAAALGFFALWLGKVSFDDAALVARLASRQDEPNRFSLHGHDRRPRPL